jgi:hypothetical protein
MKPERDLPGYKVKLSSKRSVHVARCPEKHCWLIDFSDSRGKKRKMRLSDSAMGALLTCVCTILEDNETHRR